MAHVGNLREGRLLGQDISRSEKAFIEEGVLQGMRNDGRGRLDYRTLGVTPDVLPQTNGSARVVVGV